MKAVIVYQWYKMTKYENQKYDNKTFNKNYNSNWRT